MIDQIITTLTGFIISFISSAGYLGIFVLMAAEACLIPIPSEVTLPFAGYLASQGTLNVVGVIIVGALADLTGSLIAYGIGYWGEDHLIRRLIKKYGKYILVSEGEYDKSEKWFRKYGQGIVFIGRLLPVVRTYISLPAGIAKMNLAKFSLFTFIGVLIWSTFLSLVGFYLGKNWQSLEPYYRKFEYVIVGLIVVVGIWYVYHKVKKLRHK